VLTIRAEDRKKIIFIGLLFLVLLGNIIYSNVLYAPFVYDDRVGIADNEEIKNLNVALRNISVSRYVGYASFAFNFAMGGLRVVGYHVTNNLIHIIDALLVCYLVSLFFKTAAMKDSVHAGSFVALASAFLFVAHPIQTQAVSYLSQRFTSLATMFYLIAIVFYMKARLVQEEMRESSEPALRFSKPIGFYFLSVLSSICAVKTKEIAVTLPLMLIACELFFFGGNAKRLKRLVSIILMALMLIVLLLMPSGSPGIKESLADIATTIDTFSRETVTISRADYLATQVRVVVTYLRLLIFPVNQNLDYDYPIYRTIFSGEGMLRLSVLVGMIVIALLTYKKARLISFGIVWFFVTLSVESSVIPIRDVINEHRVYLPSIGFFIVAVAALDTVIAARKMKIGIIALVVLLFSIGAFNRNYAWSSAENLWSDVISKSPRNARAYNNLGVVYKEDGEYQKAIEQFGKALREDENFAGAYYNLGDIQYKLGRYEEAVSYLTQAREVSTEKYQLIDILNKLGRTYGAMGQTQKAIEVLEGALRQFPSAMTLINNLGVQYIKNYQPDKAIGLYEKALKNRGDYAVYVNLSVAYAQKGDMQKSRLLRQKAETLKSGQ
jgi:tetratricopeptide (TPR) repeat protein